MEGPVAAAATTRNVRLGLADRSGSSRRQPASRAGQGLPNSGTPRQAPRARGSFLFPNEAELALAAPAMLETSAHATNQATNPAFGKGARATSAAPAGSRKSLPDANEFRPGGLRPTRASDLGAIRRSAPQNRFWGDPPKPAGHIDGESAAAAISPGRLCV